MKCIIATMFAALLFVSLLCHPSRSFAGIAHISVDTCDVEQICISATQIEGITGLDLDISFDSIAMANVQLEPSGLLLARGTVSTSVNPSGSGRMIFSGSEAVEGSGVVTIVRYQRTSEAYQGKITSATVLATDENGVTKSIPVVINNSPDPLLEREKEATSGPDSQPEESSRHEVSETIRPAPQERAIAEKGAAGQTSVAATVKRDGVAGKANREGRTIVCRSILNSFLELKAERDFAAILKILDQCRELQFRQEPSLVLSDGKTVVTVSITLDIQGKRAPVFLLEGARFRTLREFAGNEWEIDLLPDKGVMETRLSVYYDDDRIYGIPIALAPPLEIYASGKSAASQGMQQKIDEYVKLVNAHVLSSTDSAIAAK